MGKANGNYPPSHGFEEWKKEIYPKPKVNVIFKKTRICPKCKKEFPATLEYFYKSSSRKDGLRLRCIECEKTVNKVYVSKRRQRSKELRDKDHSSCKYCGKTWESFASRRGHEQWCEKNPNSRRNKLKKEKLSDKFMKIEEEYTLEELRDIDKKLHLTDEQIAKYIRGKK